MTNKLEIDREQFESANPVPFGVFWSDPDSRYMTTMVHLNCLEYQGKWLGWQSAMRAAPVVERQEPVAWANWKVGTKSYVPFRNREEAARSVEGSEIAATQLGPYRVVALYAEPVPPLIQTLHANGDRIAMEATIAQQAQRIADLERGRGEPVAVVRKVVTDTSTGYEGVVLATAIISGLVEDGTKLYTSPPAPVAMVLPDLLPRNPGYWPDLDLLDKIDDAEAKGFNRAIDKVKELNQ